MAFPITTARLDELSANACESTLQNVDKYDHAQTEAWNTSIINTILQSLSSECKSSDSASTPYKFAVNSTIIQHMSDSGSQGSGRRGMHSATGAYWNSERDGMWNYKYEGGASKGLDIVISVIWIAT